MNTESMVEDMLQQMHTVDKLSCDINVEAIYKNNRIMLNSYLVNKQGLTQDVVDDLLETHKVRHFLFERCQKAVDRKDKKWIKLYANAYEQLQFIQQKLWGFPQDKSYHCWYDLPGCTCPKMDNAERRGTPYQITALNCPIHGE